MLWLLLTALVVILGAELNCELERQTRRDTTTGAPRTIGTRGAYAADTVGSSTDTEPDGSRVGEGPDQTTPGAR